jgi:uncharacterized protein (AIM24 family)
MARLHFSRSSCQISGAYVPVAEISLDATDSVYFSHHVLLHAEPSIGLDTMRMPDGWHRVLAGQPLVMMTARGPGHIAVSADDPGDTIAVPLAPGQVVDVREHHFLVATGNVQYHYAPSHLWLTSTYEHQKITQYPVGQFLDQFRADSEPGLVLLHAPGNTFVRDLAPGEQVLIKPRSLIWKDQTTRMSLHTEHSAGGRGYNLWVKLQGPGRAAVSSISGWSGWRGMLADSSPRTRKSWEPTAGQ